jgi:S-adenosylmethionine decarboxylase
LILSRTVEIFGRTKYCKIEPFILFSTRWFQFFHVFVLDRVSAFQPRMIVGTEWMIDAAGCSDEALRDVEQLRAVFQRIIAELHLQVVGEMAWQKFPPPGGVTGIALLTESHLTTHTYPEFGVATFNLYCCRTRPSWPWADRLREMLGAQEVRVQVIERRAPAADEQQATAGGIS